MDQNELERVAGKLGNREAARLDIERAATAVLARLRARPAAVWWANPALLRLAAAVTIAVGAAGLAYRFGYTSGRTGVLPAPVALRTLSNNELEEVLDSLAYEAPAFEQAAGMGTLTEDQLRELLRKMEG